MNIKKMFTSLSAMVVAVTMTLPSASVFGATYSQELQDAYDWAYSKGVTTQSPIDNANMYGAITRAEMAKMLSVYAEEVLGVTADETKACNFTDIDSVKGDLHDFIIKSCKLGIMGQGITAFRPYDTLSRAEFGTALSRVLWGNKYEGGTPYYANHLNALKAAGIMNQIANAESTKEIRGYVMLMLMRSEGGEVAVNCDDEMIALACQLGTDACPAECKADNNKEEDNTSDVVKSGSLVVEADAATERSAIKWAASDLDTLTFKTSEEVEISKVVLERYGYSAPADVEAVRLEDSNGTVVAEEKEVTSKDQVTLTIKKDYRKVDGSTDWTIVVRLAKLASGSTIGFKVKDVTSTAKDNDFWNYKPYLYDIVTYDAVSVSLDDKGSNKDYNYEEGEMYEVAKLKIKANTSALEVNGVNLLNVSTGTKLDLKKFIDKVEVVVAGKSLKGVSYTINEDDELDISFDSYEIEAKGNATFTVNISLKNFDEYGDSVHFAVAKSSDVKITEKKTWARVSVTLPTDKLNKTLTDADYAGVWSDRHAFEGSKIRLSGKKLGNVDAAQASDDVLVLDWEIEVAEAIDKWTFSLTGILENFSGVTATTVNPIEEMTLVVNGTEYSANREKTPNWTVASGSATTVFTFENVEVEESGKFQILIDIDDDAIQWGTITLKPTINKALFTGSVRYTDAHRSPVKQSEVKGSISFASKITIQPSKASLTNTLSKRVEFTTNDSTKKTVFDGVYTAKKGTVKLNTALITGDLSATNINTRDITFYLYIDGEEVATLDPNKSETFSDIEIAANESVKVKVEAEVNSDVKSAQILNFSLELSGEDDNGNSNAGNATKRLVDMKVVEKGTFSITTSASKNTALLKARGESIAQFTIKPSNNTEGLTLEDVVLTWYYTLADGTTKNFSGDDIRFEIDGTEYTCDDESYASGLLYYVNEELPSAGWKPEIFLEEEVAGEVVVEVAFANGLKQNKTFKKFFANALAYIKSQQNEDSFTQYFLGVDLFDDAYTVSGFQLFTDKACTSGLQIDGLNTEIDDNDDFTINNTTSAQTIRCVRYRVYDENNDLLTGNSTTATGAYEFNNDDYADYFKVDGSSAWRVFANK